MPSTTIAAADVPAFRGWLAAKVAARTLAPEPDLSPLSLCAALGITPDSWQEQLLTSTAERICLNTCRQSGKSTMTAILACHQALTVPDSLVLLLSPSWRQSSELFKKCLTVYGAAGRPVAAASETALSLTLTNRSRLVSLPGKEATIRGYSRVSLLCVDEAARVPDSLYYAIRPMLAVSAGRLVTLSTPFSTRGWWYQAWEHGGGDWQRFEIPAPQCPRISPEFLAEEQRSLGSYFFEQEYLCRFLDSQASMFRSADIEAAFDGAETWAL